MSDERHWVCDECGQRIPIERTEHQCWRTGMTIKQEPDMVRPGPCPPRAPTVLDLQQDAARLRDRVAELEAALERVRARVERVATDNRSFAVRGCYVAVLDMLDKEGL